MQLLKDRMLATGCKTDVMMFANCVLHSKECRNSFTVEALMKAYLPAKRNVFVSSQFTHKTHIDHVKEMGDFYQGMSLVKIRCTVIEPCPTIMIFTTKKPSAKMSVLICRLTIRYFFVDVSPVKACIQSRHGAFHNINCNANLVTGLCLQLHRQRGIRCRFR